MSQRYRFSKILFLSLALTFSAGVFADDGELSGDEMDEIFDDVNHGGGGESATQASSNDLEDHKSTSTSSSRDDFSDPAPVASTSHETKREKVDDDEDAAAEIGGSVGDSLTESNSFRSYTPEPEVTAEQFIHGGAPFKGSEDPGSFNYEAPKKKKAAKVSKTKGKSKKVALKKKKTKKIAKASKSSKSKSRKIASAKKSKNKRYR